jgi:hypothetical protein
VYRTVCSARAEALYLGLEVTDPTVQGLDGGQRDPDLIDWLDHPVRSPEAECGREVLRQWPQMADTRLKLVRPIADR